MDLGRTESIAKFYGISSLSGGRVPDGASRFIIDYVTQWRDGDKGVICVVKRVQDHVHARAPIPDAKDVEVVN